jgi:hypothetical protein
MEAENKPGDRAHQKGDDWRRTNSLGIEGLPKVGLVANEIYKVNEAKIGTFR